MPKYTSYDASTGKITGHVEQPVMYNYDENGEVTGVFTGGLPKWEGYFLDEDQIYFVDGAPADRPECPATLTGQVLSGVPAGAKLTVNEVKYQIEQEEYEADGTDIEFEFPPGKHTVKVELFPFMTKVFEVTV